jgi:hypothetical protein
MSSPNVLLVRELLGSGSGSLKELLVYSFRDDVEAYDDELQARVERDFVAAFDTAVADLTTEFGEPTRRGSADDSPIPLCGVFRFAVWAAEGHEWYLAAAHEDREMPYLLLVGIV